MYEAVKNHYLKPIDVFSKNNKNNGAVKLFLIFFLFDFTGKDFLWLE